MAETVLAAFDRFESVDMLVVLPEFTGLTPAAALDLEGLKAGFRSLGKVRRYAVVEPPKIAALMIETSDWFMPVQARTFPPDAEGRRRGVGGASLSVPRRAGRDPDAPARPRACGGCQGCSRDRDL